MKTLPCALLATSFIFQAARADVKLPAIISDHMVVQSGVEVPVWGWAEPGEEVAVSFAGQTKATKGDADGKWAVKLDKLKSAGEAQTLTVKGKNTRTVADVLIGEVWLGSGQSNMALQVQRANNPAEEAAAAQFPKMRMFTVRSSAAHARRRIARAPGKSASRRRCRSFRRRRIFSDANCIRRLVCRLG